MQRLTTLTFLPFVDRSHAYFLVSPLPLALWCVSPSSVFSLSICHPVFQPSRDERGGGRGGRFGGPKDRPPHRRDERDRSRDRDSRGGAREPYRSRERDLGPRGGRDRLPGGP